MSVFYDPDRLASLTAREQQSFVARTQKSMAMAQQAAAHMPGGVPMAWMAGLYRTPPLYIAGGKGASFTDIDGNRYLDFNVADLAMTMGYGPEAITRAVTKSVSEGALFLLPDQEAPAVAEALARRNGLPYWQFTLSASGANTEVIRIARFITGREKILVFGGHYHGHIDEMLVDVAEGGFQPGLLGLPKSAAAHTIIAPFNDLEAAEQVLAREDIAVVMTEPALTNCNVVLPEEGFHAGLRALTQKHGSLLSYDEAHTYQFGYGGLYRAWGLAGDFQVLGKGLGTGISFALYGMSEEIGRVVAAHIDVDTEANGLALGGTTYASALAVATAKAALEEVLTESNYARIAALGERLSNGLEAVFEKHGLPWRAFRLGPRSGFCMSDTLPRNVEDAARSLDNDLIDARRAFMANRGIWDSVASAGPQASFAHTEQDIDRYVETVDAFFSELK